MNQTAWRWCNKCQSLNFVANPHLGPCAGGGVHDNNGSGRYTASSSSGTPSGPDHQSNWKWCKNCQELTYGGSNKLGACSAGGQHDHTGSGDYALLANSPQVGQDNWKWCAKCQAICFAGNQVAGACPAGGTHDHTGSGNYSLLVEVNSNSYTVSVGGISAGKVDMNGATVILVQDGTWTFYGSLHDNSTWYGDNWAYGFVIGASAHGTVAKGVLGEPDVWPLGAGTFRMSGTDPWITNNWQTVAYSKINTELNVSGDPSAVVSNVVSALEKYGPQLVALL